MKIAVIYWSSTGNTESLANSIAGIIISEGRTCDIFSVSQITSQKAAEYETLILGCPAMGAEVLEEDEFEPFYSALEPLLTGKKVGLFGSYDWGDGEWMRNWQSSAESAGVKIVDTLVVNVNDSASEKCAEFAKKFI